MKILFIGGTGIISSACSKEAIRQGMSLYLLNRGKSSRPLPEGAHSLVADYRNPSEVKAVLANHAFDAVVNWIAYTPADIKQDLEYYRDRTKQYIFISSASAYQTPPASLPVTKSTILDNPVWQYSRDKIACEEALVQAFRQEKFPMTIVRPSHTYDASYLPIHGGWTVIDRMLHGQKIIVHGDGTSLWTLTHHADFARAFVGLLGNSRAIGEAVHITSDEWLTWNQIHQLLASAIGVTPDIVHVPSDLINAFDPGWGDGLLGDKAASMVFDNSLIKRLVPGWSAHIPFSIGAREIIQKHLSEPSLQITDSNTNQMIDRILDAYSKAWPN